TSSSTSSETKGNSDRGANRKRYDADEIERKGSERVNAIEMRALRKVYKGTGKVRGGGSSQSARWAPPGTMVTSPGDVVALESLDLDIQAGEFFGLLGPNGAGKTTAIAILTTRVLPTSGKAIVAGADVVSDSVRVRQRSEEHTSELQSLRHF